MTSKYNLVRKQNGIITEIILKDSKSNFFISKYNENLKGIKSYYLSDVFDFLSYNISVTDLFPDLGIEDEGMFYFSTQRNKISRKFKDISCSGYKELFLMENDGKSLKDIQNSLSNHIDKTVIGNMINFPSLNEIKNAIKIGKSRYIVTYEICNISDVINTFDKEQQNTIIEKIKKTKLGLRVKDIFGRELTFDDIKNFGANSSNLAIITNSFGIRGIRMSKWKYSRSILIDNDEALMQFKLRNQKQNYKIYSLDVIKESFWSIR